MTYWMLDVLFLLPAGAVWTAALVRRRAVYGSAGTLVAAGAQAGMVLLALTCIFDNAMIAAGLFDYSPEHISGLRIALAPLEDLAYPLAAVLLLPGLWLMLGNAGPDLPAAQEAKEESHD